MPFRTIFLFAVALLVAVPAMAQDNSVYTVSNVHVDANGASSTEALNTAIAQGRGKAFQIVYRRLRATPAHQTSPAAATAQPSSSAGFFLKLS